jgi:ribosomal protein L7/L12
VSKDVIELARAGNRLGAIKRYRELTGASLADAQAAVFSI